MTRSHRDAPPAAPAHGAAPTSPFTSALVALAALATLVAVPMTAAPPPSRTERDVVPGGRGPNRLEVDVALLAGSEPWDAGSRTGLSDLRLVDGQGREVPYLLIDPPRAEVEWAAGRVLPVAATRDTSGFEVDLGRPRRVDGLRLLGLPAPFLKRVRLEGSGDRARWTLLAGEGTLFDLPAESLTRLVLDFPPGDLQFLRVTWDDALSGRVPLPVRAEVRLVPSGSPPPPLRVPMPFEKRPGEPGASRFRVRLAAPRLPLAALELVPEGGHLLRPARVSESRLSGSELVPVVLGSATLRRAERGELRADDLTIPVGPPLTAELEISVDDGSNPPLVLREVAAVFRELPWIYFESPDGAPLVARSGARGAAAPRYDLEAVRRAVTRGEPPVPFPARWGETRPAAAKAPVEAPDGIVGAGSPVDVSGFRYRRAIPQGPEGLVALSLDAAVLSGSHDLADVRIVDGAGRQVPYIGETLAERLTLPLPVPQKVADPRPRPPAGQTVYRLQLPYPDLPDARLSLAAGVRVFRREVELFVERLPRASDRSEPSASFETLARSGWANADPGSVPPPLTVELPRTGRTELFLAVDDGDNSPLPVVAPVLSLPARRLLFRRAAGAELTLVHGNPRAAAPRYDLALLAPQLLAEPAAEVTLGPPGEDGPAPGQSGSPRARWLFWGALGLGVLALLAILARLLARGA